MISSEFRDSIMDSGSNSGSTIEIKSAIKCHRSVACKHCDPDPNRNNAVKLTLIGKSFLYTPQFFFRG